MPDYKGAITLFEHDSDCCIYLGACIKNDADSPYSGEYDLYICRQDAETFGQREYVTILARFGNDGSEYYSGLCFATEDRNVIIWEGAKRAIALGLMTQEELDRETAWRTSASIRFESAGTIENGVATSYTVLDEE